MPKLKASSANNNADNNSNNDVNHDVANGGDSNKDIAAIAYFLWMDRGCPEGSPDEDWFQAEALATTASPLSKSY